PRYYLIIPELRRIFPRARFIILVRNPLSVLHSVITTWARDLNVLRSVRYDLLDAPLLLTEGIELLNQSVSVLRYEDLVRDPVGEVSRVCGYLGIEFDPGMIRYNAGSIPRWDLGDSSVIYNRTGPDKTRAEVWREGVLQPQTWRLMFEYLEFLGPGLVERLGYDYDALKLCLSRSSPPSYRLIGTRSLKSCTTNATASIID